MISRIATLFWASTGGTCEEAKRHRDLNNHSTPSIFPHSVTRFYQFLPVFALVRLAIAAKRKFIVSPCVRPTVFQAFMSNEIKGKIDQKVNEWRVRACGAITLQARPGKRMWRASWREFGRLVSRSTGVPHTPSNPTDHEKNKQFALLQAQLIRASRLVAVRRDMTIRQYVQSCLKTSKGAKGEILTLFVKSLGERADDHLMSIAREHQRRYLLLRGEELGYTTLRRELKFLATVFGYAVEQGVLDYNPIELTDIEDWFLRDGLAELQIKAILLATQNIEWRTATLLGYYTGAALAQILRLEWAALKESPDITRLEFPAVARVKGREVAVHPALLGHLNSLRRVSAFVCPALNRLEPWTAEARFSEIVAAAALPDTVIFGTLKRTFAAALGVHINRVDAISPEAPLTLKPIRIPPLPCQLSIPE